MDGDSARDYSISLPRFRLRCKLASDDETAWIEIFRVQEGRVLTDSIGSVLARARPDVQLKYEAAPGSGRRVKSAAEVRQELVLALNQARAKAGMGSLQIAEAQAYSNEQLAPVFFRAQKQADVTDAIALGLLAGWDVQGTIRDGNFYAWLEGGTTDAHQLLDAVLERPLARSVLLDPEARQIAIGAALGAKGHGLRALITTYEFFRSNDGELASKKLLERIVRERRGRGLPHRR